MRAAQPGRRGPLRIVLAVIGLLALAGVVTGIVLAQQAAGRDRRATAAEQHTYRSLRSERRLVLAEVDGLSTRIARASHQDSALAKSLHRTSKLLTRTDAMVGQAQATSADNEVDIADLNACLGGVQAALNELSVGDQTGAVASLSSVSAQCSGASG